jgi:hypothetical protein
MKTVAVVPVRGTSNAWKVAEPSDPPAPVHEREVALEIQGNPRDGYHLLMSPTGYFTADTWHQTVEDAKDAAHRWFGVPPEAWT